jgi:hypothetical protein
LDFCSFDVWILKNFGFGIGIISQVAEWGKPKPVKLYYFDDLIEINFTKRTK